MQADVYRVLRRPARAEIKVKGSRFIAEAFPVETEAEATEALASVRRREHAATHHCSAYRVGRDGALFRFDDDGEPSGTAGQPILRQIDARGLTNTLVVVTRYFGGTKLGTGGLIRAYGDAASEVLDAAGVEERVRRSTVYLRFAYPDTSPAMHVIGRYDAQVVRHHYGEATELWVAVRCSEVEAFRAAFVEALAGRGEVRPAAEG
ncbi:MAG: hypothetical protein KatS3mg044_0745 [Rhodothermaceae bacterium]|nr:MAG: YigZ family protein [Bacteroidota bacterium]GIV61879.1 MAG: hypothetical protein KatS3mg044_0745 [Rhodothermaceae bacterium]